MDVVPAGLLPVMTPSEADVLGRQLGEAIRWGYTARGWQVPPLLAEWRRILARAAQDHPYPQVSAGDVPSGFRDDTTVPASEQPVRLTATEAANLAGVSEGYMRRLIRRGDVEASRGRRGAWAVDISSLAAWISQRREERNSKVA